MADLIDRQVTINEIKALYEWHDTVTEDRVIDHLMRLPSAQPDVPDTTFGNMISRQAAIDTVRSYYDECDEREESIEERIERLPSADIDLSNFSDKLWKTAYERGKAEAVRWIPWGSGKFPEESGTYTVTAYDGATERVTYAKYQKRLKRWELTGARAYWRVLAWMPLPEPYKDGKQDG